MNTLIALWAQYAPSPQGYWHGVQIAFVIAAIVILISSSEDLFLDLMFWWHTVTRPLFGERRPKTRALRNHPEKMAAILIPAWHEDGVIGHMIDVAQTYYEYTNYHIFVGVYPNDAATIAEVESAANDYPNVHCIIAERPGPTTKADCVNQLIRRAIEAEAGLGQRFAFFVNHDAEDVVHAFELKLMNWYIETCGMIQIPVLSLPRDTLRFVACHYMDEFAEWHSKDLVVRSAISGVTPSAGVGTGIGRDALDALLEARDGEAFNRASLTEDYDLSQFLASLGFNSRFVRYRADMPYLATTRSGKHTVLKMKRELVSTQEFFPSTVRTAVRQKARWMLGISLLGWRQFGWRGTFNERYFLWRDRKILFTAPAAIVAYILVLQILAADIATRFVPGFPTLPPVIASDWVWAIVMINLGLMLNRLFHRALFVWYAHGLRYVPLSPLRVVTSNWIGFRALLRALRQFIFASLTGRALKWDKTTHSFPIHAGSSASRQRTSKLLCFLLAAGVALGTLAAPAPAGDAGLFVSGDNMQISKAYLAREARRPNRFAMSVGDDKVWFSPRPPRLPQRPPR